MINIIIRLIGVIANLKNKTTQNDNDITSLMSRVADLETRTTSLESQDLSEVNNALNQLES